MMSCDCSPSLSLSLRTMDENMTESDDFDRVVQGVTDGTYRPSPSAGMETFPVSSHFAHSSMHSLGVSLYKC